MATKQKKITKAQVEEVMKALGFIPKNDGFVVKKRTFSPYRVYKSEDVMKNLEQEEEEVKDE
jgi:hypothetical protein